MEKYILGLMFKLLLINLFLIIFKTGFCQDRIDDTRIHLDSLSRKVPGLTQEIDITVSKMPIQEFIRNIANSNKINMSVDPGLNMLVTNNFSDVTALDMLLFMCSEYDLEIYFTGEIINIVKWEKPEERRFNDKDIKFDPANKTVSVDFLEDTLWVITKAITQITGQNVIFKPEISNRLITVFLKDLPVGEAIEKLAIANNLKMMGSGDVYILEDDYIKEQENDNKSQKQQSRNIPTGRIYFNAYSKEKINVYGINVSVYDLINEISKSLDLDYFLYSAIESATTVNLTGIGYEDLLNYVLNGSDYTFTKDNGIYLIGKRELEGLRRTVIMSLTYRSVTNLLEVIPTKLSNGVELKEFPELNSIIISGSYPLIREIEAFIESIDQVVPLILIEVLIVNNKTGYTIATGISAGIASEPVESGGTFLPGIDYTLGAGSINKLLNSFNGFGIANLGKVNPNFYITLQAMEEEGMIEVTSTPKLSTLNGHEANLKIGNTEYYVEETTDFVVTQSTQERTTRRYQSVTADFSLTIIPIVAGDDHVTLDVKVEQSDFTERISKNAPPGQISRSFTSLIRVKNEEMILLGGLESRSRKDSGRGIPLLSRIPILKWLFSSRVKEKSDEKLNVFIKPTIFL